MHFEFVERIHHQFADEDVQTALKLIESGETSPMTYCYAREASIFDKMPYVVRGE